MDEFVTERAARPASSEHRFVPIEVFSAYSAQAGLNPEQHRLPFPATFSNTHKSRSIAGRSQEKQAKGRLLGPASGNPIARLSLQMHHGRNKDGLPFHNVDQTIRKPLEEIAPKPAFQDAPGTRVLLNVIESRLNGIKEFQPYPLAGIFVEFCCLTDFSVGFRIEKEVQRTRSRRI